MIDGRKRIVKMFGEAPQKSHLVSNTLTDFCDIARQLQVAHRAQKSYISR